LRQQFGRRSEQLTPDQLLLGIEDLEQTVAERQAGQDASDPSADNRSRGARPAPTATMAPCLRICRVMRC
jgi:transposase